MSAFKDHYCFIHLPKSAGTSILSFLRAALGEANVLHFHTPGAHRHTPLEYLITRYRALVGHFEVSELSEWMFNNAFMFTFLRDPVDRVLSNYRFYRNVRHDFVVPEMLRAQQLDLRSLFMELDPSRLTVWSNWQTFVLSGLEHSEFVPGTILEPARQTLARLDFVGFYESLDEDMRELCRIGGWDPHIPLPRENVTPLAPPTPAVDPETLALIRDLNRDDIALYQYAKALPRKPHPKIITSTSEIPSSLPLNLVTRSETGAREIFISSLTATGVEDSPEIEAGQRIEIGIKGESTIDCLDLVAGIRITNTLGFEVYGTNTLLLDAPMAVRPGQQFTISFAFPAILGPGNYYLTAALHNQAGHNFHWIDNHAVFAILPEKHASFAGLVNLHAELKIVLSPGQQL